MNHPKRTLKLLALLICIAVPITVYCYLARRPHVSEYFTTQRPGESKILWRTMELAWERAIIEDGSPSQISDVTSHEEALYISSNGLISRVNRASGKIAWSKHLLRRGESFNNDWQWAIEPTADRLVATKIGSNGGAGAIHSPRLCCLRAKSGSYAWDMTPDTPVASKPSVSGSRIFVPLTSGEVMCLSVSSGSKLWRRRISLTRFKPDHVSQSPVIEVRSDEHVCIARVGSHRFLAIDPSTGEILWSTAITGSMRHAEQMDERAMPYTLDGGVIYVSPTTAKLFAWNALTGAVLWRCRFHVPRGQDVDYTYQTPIVMHDFVLAQTGTNWAAVRRADGALLWDGLKTKLKSDGTPDLIQDASSRGSSTLYCTDTSDPVVNHAHYASRTLQTNDIVAIDAATGKERWRNQVAVADNLQGLVPQKDRLYCWSWDRLFTLQPGHDESLPGTTGGRTQFAYRMIEDLTQWNPHHESAFAKLLARIPIFTKPIQSNISASTTRAKLCLLRMRNDSIEPLLELISHEIHEIDHPDPQNPSISSGNGWDTENELEIPLNLLEDIRAYSAVPAIIADLDSTKSPMAKQYLAELLIRLNRTQAFGPLYRYVRSCKDTDTIGGEETLAYLCRFAPPGRPQKRGDVTQDLLTEFLLTSYSDAKSPVWLRRYARFELSRGRGDVARALALAGFGSVPRARLMPTFEEAMAPYMVNQPAGFTAARYIQVKVKDPHGTWWGLFQSQYLYSPDVWLIQSSDGTHWKRPTVCLPQDAIGSSPKLTWLQRNGGPHLKLEWRENRRHKEVRIIWLNDVYRDSDGDGIPDVVEKEIGTNPHAADSHHVGLRDGDNKNPNYSPHSLSQKEQIYQAIVETICIYSQYRQPKTIRNSYAWSELIDPDSPLLVPPGPSGVAVPIYNHQHTVFMYSARQAIKLSRLNPDIQFNHPITHIDGTARLVRPGYEAQAPTNWDPTDKKLTFSSYFPYEVSRDGTQVRVGVRGAAGVFDVEVDRIQNRWIPVDCRLVWQSGRNREQWVVAAPLNELSGVPAAP